MQTKHFRDSTSCHSQVPDPDQETAAVAAPAAPAPAAASTSASTSAPEKQPLLPAGAGAAAAGAAAAAAGAAGLAAASASAAQRSQQPAESRSTQRAVRQKNVVNLNQWSNHRASAHSFEQEFACYLGLTKFALMKHSPYSLPYFNHYPSDAHILMSQFPLQCSEYRCCHGLQAKDTVIDIPVSKTAAAKAARKQSTQVDPRRQSLASAAAWTILTSMGMIYIAAVICLCAWPVVHFIVQFAFHVSLVGVPSSNTYDA